MTTLRAAIRIRKRKRSRPSRMVLSGRERVEGPRVLSSFPDVLPMHPSHFLQHALYQVTESLDQRISTHNSGKGAEWIKAHRGARLVYYESHATLGSARKREIQLKKWSRAKKEALIAGDF